MTAFRAFGDAATDRGLHLGDGVFETVLVVAGRPSFLTEHTARLVASCKALGLPEPRDLFSVVRNALPELWADEERPARASLRITVTRGPWTGLAADAGAVACVYLMLRALPAEAPRPLDAVVIGAPRIDPSSPLAGHKTLSWMAHVEARRRAVAAGGHIALLRTTDGDIAEADAANLFVVLGDAIVTPPLDRGILPGITRGRVLQALRQRGGPAVERRIEPGDITRATAAFVTSSLAGVVPLRSVDGRALASPAAAADWLAKCVLPDEVRR